MAKFEIILNAEVCFKFGFYLNLCFSFLKNPQKNNFWGMDLKYTLKQDIYFYILSNVLAFNKVELSTVLMFWWSSPVLSLDPARWHHLARRVGTMPQLTIQFKASSFYQPITFNISCLCQIQIQMTKPWLFIATLHQ